MPRKVQELQDDALKLLCVEDLGGKTLAAIVLRAGGLDLAAEAVFSGEVNTWLPNGDGNVLIERMERMEIDGMRWSADAIDASIVTVMDDDFPQLLYPLPSCPAILWYRGNLNCVTRAAVAIVGSRRCTAYGIEQTNLFSSEIAQSDITIISGGARGIDAASHRSALRHQGKTVAILGSGLSVLYPPEHESLFNTIIAEGGVVISEFPCNRPPQPAYFPRRNRIVSGLSSTVLVIEAARRSGALITARIAVEEHGRHAFAVPGRIGDTASEGCLRCILDGWLELALEPSRVIEEATQAWKRLSSTFDEVINTCEELQ